MPELINKEISSLFTVLIILIGVTFILCMITYGSSFSFWNSAFSDLGSTITPDGRANSFAFVVFITGIIISGLLFFQISRVFLKDKELVHHRLKSQISLMGSIGCFVFTFPHNINNNIHMIGAALFVAAVWALGTLLLIEARKTGRKERTTLLQSLLQGTVITYAVTYFADLPVKNIAQKFAVLGLMIVLKSATAQKIRNTFYGLITIGSKNK